MYLKNVKKSASTEYLPEKNKADAIDARVKSPNSKRIMLPFGLQSNATNYSIALRYCECDSLNDRSSTKFKIFIYCFFTRCAPTPHEIKKRHQLKS